MPGANNCGVWCARDRYLGLIVVVEVNQPGSFGDNRLFFDLLQSPFNPKEVDLVFFRIARQRLPGSWFVTPAMDVVRTYRWQVIKDFYCRVFRFW